MSRNMLHILFLERTLKGVACCHCLHLKKISNHALEITMSSAWVLFEMAFTAIFIKGGGERSYTVVDKGKGP